MACFHIRWLDSKLDWECHSTQAQAELVAQELAHPEEGFTIEKYQDGEGTLPCPFQRQRRL
jgi:hypothetical protein